MRLLAGIIIGSTFLAGCFPVPPKIDHDTVIKNHGGYEALRADANAMFVTATNDCVAPSNYSPLIKFLAPQYVAVQQKEPPVLIIQTMGGFHHRGLLVVVGTNTNYRPEIGHGWARKELAPCVFEFEE